MIISTSLVKLKAGTVFVSAKRRLQDQSSGEIMSSHKPVNPFDLSALGVFSLSFCLSVCLSVCHVALKSL